MDPEPLNHLDWVTTSHVLHWIWLILAFVFLFAAHMTLTHAIIPSLIDSGHLPDGIRERARKLRIPLYAIAFVFLGMVALWGFLGINAAKDIRHFWPTIWI